MAYRGDRRGAGVGAGEGRNGGVAVLVPAVRGGPSVTDPAGLAVPDTADGFFGVLHHWDSSYFQGIAADGYFGAGADAPGRGVSSPATRRPPAAWRRSSPSV